MFSESETSHCIVCYCPLGNSDAGYEFHSRGKRHQRLVDAKYDGYDPGLQRPDLDRERFCEACDVYLFGQDWKYHKNKTSHKKKLKKFKQSQTMSELASRYIPPVISETKAEESDPTLWTLLASDEPSKAQKVHACANASPETSVVSYEALIPYEPAMNTIITSIEEGPKDADEGMDINHEAEGHIDKEPDVNVSGDTCEDEAKCEDEARCEDEAEDQDDDKNTFDEVIRKRSQHIFRLVELAPDLQRLVVQGRLRLIAQRDGFNPVDLLSEPELSSFGILCDLIAGLREELIRMSEKEAIDFAKRMADIATAARGIDVRKAKTTIIEILVYLDDSFKVEQEELVVKGNRGFRSDKLGEMICPVDLDWGDDEVRRKIRKGEVEVSADLFPRGIYQHCKCSPDDYEHGLLKNEVLVHLTKLIFTGRGPAFARAAGDVERATVAEISGMKEMTPRAIAYCACLLRYSISDKETWSLVDGNFNMLDFYWSIVEIFDGSESSNELLRWWNVQIFGSQCNAKTRKRPLTTLHLLKAQREAKRARAEHGPEV